ncbi:glycosyltransferase family 4 protein [Radiobacillus kanasensis]|uniref:glycosyltransferase family 4 protein n=1 Tax=Radiobacillus kanasensis TaxID=2844358 RepID=UPI001E5DD7B2|nr:glycosyltransferase family 4 protein [Radiobacillus kanasensis]UFU00044.1 glycosyltransferase family 4 protein [Radiobacillus kanasensis]
MIDLKVLHIPYGPPMIELCHALREKGVHATSCHFNENTFKFKPDECLKLNLLNGREREKRLEQFLQESIQQYDIFHFHFGETFFPDKRDLEVLKQAGKKMVVHHHGSDIRKLSVAKRNNPYIKVKPEWTEEKINKNLAILSDYIDHAIVQDYELEAYISNSYKHVHVIPHTIDVRKFEPEYPTEKKSPLVVHAPTMRDLKGTEFILNAIERLKEIGMSFEFKLLEGLTYEETKKTLSQADIVIDQLRIGASGYISSEAMAFGKPVICYIREDLVSKYPQGLPIVNANPSNITGVLRKLLQHPQKWNAIGREGRQYVEKYHNPAVVANQYIEMYKRL